MTRKYPNPFRQYENSIFTNSRGYDPLRQPPLIHVSIADGRVIADRLDPVSRGYGNGYQRVMAQNRQEVMAA